MFKLHDFQINEITANAPNFDFLNLSGRKIFYNQGYYGQNVIVAVLDTGVNGEHPELQGKVLQGRNFCDYRDYTDARDDNGHGTHVAGSIAGLNCGIANQSHILPVKVLAGDGSGQIEWMINALNWVNQWRDTNGNKVDIVSMSLGADGKYMTQTQINQIHQAVKQLVDNNIAVIVSSGNTGDFSTTQIPASLDEPITVGAVDIDKLLAYFSTKGSFVDVCQVGVNVVSAWFEGGYATMSGTSMSTPIVSGIAALIVSKYKKLFNKPIPEIALYEALKLNTIDLGDMGFDTLYGAGFCTLNPNTTKKIEMYIDKNEYFVNGVKTVMDKSPEIEDNRTMLPLRVTAEALGANVDFNNELKKITITM